MSSPAPERRAFKDYFDPAAAHALAAQMAGALPGFDRTRFVALATGGLDDLEFQGRVVQFSNALAATLPKSVPRALAVLTESLPPALPSCNAVTDGWLQWPLGQFIADYGLGHFDAAMEAMIELTKRFSSEFAVRPYVERYPEATFARLSELTGDPDPHVRRWCSEGTRPRLPWGRRLHALIADPSPLWPILEALKDDPEPYVRRSVANNLNDIAKDHPELVIDRCRAWSASEERAWIVKHALRSLVKAGDPAALEVVGFAPPQKLSAELQIRPRRVAMGGEIALTARLSSRAARSQHVVVDYVVHYVRRGGKVSAKVFKWTTCRLAARGETELAKRHSLRRTTIRALYPGLHRVELQINGARLAEASFRLQGERAGRAAADR